MTEREAFLKAILDDPSEANRLPFADWLEDHGEGELARWFRQPHPPGEKQWQSERGDGDTYGDGDGYGDGGGNGNGDGYGLADGDGYSTGYGSGDVFNTGDGEIYGEGIGDHPE